MPAGLLLSPTARTVRSGPGRGPRGVAATGRRSPCLAGRNDQRPVWRRSRGSCPLLPHAPSVVGAAAAALSAIPAPETPSSRAIPGKMVGAKARPQAPPSPPGSRYGFPPLPGETRILPALPPLTGVSLPASSCAPCRKRSSPCFSPAGPPSQRCVRPAPSRPEDCALNQHFSSHPGTFVQRKMIL